MPHTDRRHGRTITLTPTGKRQYITVTVRHPQYGDLHRGTIRCAGIDNGRPVWSISTYDHDILDSVRGDFVQAEKALLDATTELDTTD